MDLSNDKPNVIKTSTPPHPKLVNTKINMVPALDHTIPLTLEQISRGNEILQNIKQVQESQNFDGLNYNGNISQTEYLNKLQTAIGGINPMLKIVNANSIPSVNQLDPRIIAQSGLNIQRPTLQPIQFPNGINVIPNLCGIQGPDQDLSTWMQKQQIALQIEQIKSKDQDNQHKTTQPQVQNEVKPINSISPQLAQFLGNESLKKSSNEELLNNLNLSVDPSLPVDTKTINELSDMFTKSQISSLESNYNQQANQYVIEQLSSVQELLKKHGIQATIDPNPLKPLEASSHQPSLIQRISACETNPNILIVPNALTQDECDKLISYVKDKLEPSKVIIKSLNVKPSTNSLSLDLCKSSTFVFNPEETVLIKILERRASYICDTDINYLEPIIVHYYGPEGYIKVHHDGIYRQLSLGIFLNDVKDGGQLEFPYSGISIRPRKGMAIIWPNLNKSGEIDYTTSHLIQKLANDSELYFLQAHFNTEPVRLEYEAAAAMKQVTKIDQKDVTEQVVNIEYK